MMCWHKWEITYQQVRREFLDETYTDNVPCARICTKCGKVQINNGDPYEYSKPEWSTVNNPAKIAILKRRINAINDSNRSVNS